MIPGMLLPRFEYEAPRDLREAVGLVAEGDERTHLLAGGTDLLVKMKRGLLRPRRVISLGRVQGLDRIEPQENGSLKVGALTTMSQLAVHPVLEGQWSALAEGAASVGGPIIRNRATVGGNVINARPCADTLPPLIALGARLHLEGPRGGRKIALDGFVQGPGETRIAPHEILSTLEIPTATGEAGSAYLKITRRRAMEVTIVGCAASLEIAPDGGHVQRARLVFTSVAPIPLRVQEAEALLEGELPEEKTLAAAARVARERAQPIDDHRAIGRYRSEMVEVTALRTLRTALSRARRSR